MIVKPQQLLKLGLNLEYLRGIASSNVRTLGDLQNCPYLLGNQPGVRYSAENVISVIKSMMELLKSTELTKAMEVAEAYKPMAQEIEDYLAKAPVKEDVRLLDHFADKVAMIAEDVLKSLRDETG
jgi:hypothetical protein